MSTGNQNTNPNQEVIMTSPRIYFDVIPYWQNLGATHGRLEEGQEGPLFTQVIQSLRYHAVVTAYRRQYYHAAMDQLEAAITEREHIARRSLKVG